MHSSVLCHFTVSVLRISAMTMTVVAEHFERLFVLLTAGCNKFSFKIYVSFNVSLHTSNIEMTDMFTVFHRFITQGLA